MLLPATLPEPTAMGRRGSWAGSIGEDSVVSVDVESGGATLPRKPMAMDRGDEDSISVAVQQLTGGEPFRIAIAATGTLAEFKRLVHERQGAAVPTARG